MIYIVLQDDFDLLKSTDSLENAGVTDTIINPVQACVYDFIIDTQ